MFCDYFRSREGQATLYVTICDISHHWNSVGLGMLASRLQHAVTGPFEYVVQRIRASGLG